MNPQWILLEPAQVHHYLISEQITLLSQHSKKELGDPLQAIINDVCAYIQNRVPETWQPNPMATNHIPSACATIACQLVIEALHTRIPEVSLSDAQKNNINQAHETLETLLTEWNKQSESQKKKPSSLIETVHSHPYVTHNRIKGL
jgi:hypothetical protein